MLFSGDSLENKSDKQASKPPVCKSKRLKRQPVRPLGTVALSSQSKQSAWAFGFSKKASGPRTLPEFLIGCEKCKVLSECRAEKGAARPTRGWCPGQSTTRVRSLLKNRTGYPRWGEKERGKTKNSGDGVWE